MRNAAGVDASIPKSFILACDVGQVITVKQKDLKHLQDGDYDVVAEFTVIETRGTRVDYSTEFRLRRVS